MKFADEKNMNELVRQISQSVAETLEPTFRTTLDTAIGKALDRAINEGRFYKYMSKEFQQGITELFKEISNFKKTSVQTEPSCLPDTQEKAEKMLSEASTQLDYIFKSTEEAATKILDIIEKNMGVQERMSALLEKEGAKVSDNGLVDELKAMNREIQHDYMEIMTALSFQDRRQKCKIRMHSSLQANSRRYSLNAGEYCETMACLSSHIIMHGMTDGQRFIAQFAIQALYAPVRFQSKLKWQSRCRCKKQNHPFTLIWCLSAVNLCLT